ncbi:MAG TPA: CHAT domain-containing protein [Actinomycetes bacterium]|nr:CHAT domain-containing protein [Actinomycetes bacterium]
MRSPLQRAVALHIDGVAANAKGQPLVAARLLREALRELDAASAGSAGSATSTAWDAPAESAAPPGSDASARSAQSPRGVGTADDELRGRILVSLAHAEAERGEVESGFRLLAEAEQLLPAEHQGVLRGQRGLLLVRTGRDTVALRELDAAVSLLQNHGEPRDLARALLNRALLNIGFGRVRPAREDLRRSADLAVRNDMPRAAAMCEHNLAFLDFVAGDLPAALKTYSALKDRYAALAPGLLPALAVDRARALLAAGLYDAADRELAWAIARFQRQRLSQDHAEAQLARAEAALLAGRTRAAGRWARLAHNRFLRRDNARWVALAALIGLRAGFPTGGSSAGSAAYADRASALAETLRGFGLTEDGRVASLLAVRAHLAAGRIAEATTELARSGRPNRSDRLDTRLLWRLVSAERASALGRVGEASRHRVTGLTELDRYRSQLGCLDLQTGASLHGRDLADAGLHAAITNGAPARIYQASERVRAQALRLPPVRPPDDAVTATALEELRQTRHALRRAELQGKPTRLLRTRSDALERTIRERAWSAVGPGTVSAIVPVDAVEAELADADAAMVAYFKDGKSLHALVMAAGSMSLVTLGELAGAEEAVLRLRTDLDAAAGRALPRRLAEAMAATTRRDAATLGAAVLEPLVHLVGERPLVVVPTGTLITLPWGVLPECADRPVTVAPSASTWHAARHRRRQNGASAGPTLLVAGPGNERGQAEVEAIGDLWPNPAILIGAAATPTATIDGMNCAQLVHLAAHGHHEEENALFSSLDLAGGPLMGYDLQRLGQAPAQVVLSACDLGLSEVRPGDETLGMVTALLSMGSATVIAGVCRVADEAAMTVMTRYHQAVRNGTTPAAALANAGASDQITSFVCFGAG